jgi:hypothetical protein
MTSGFLATGAAKESESYIHDQILPMLSMLMADAAKARRSMGLFTPKGTVRPGRGRPHLPGRMPPKYVCAAIIAEVWAFFHGGEYPAPSNRDARESAVQGEVPAPECKVPPPMGDHTPRRVLSVFDAGGIG